MISAVGLTSKERVDRYRKRKQDALLCIEGGCWEPSPDAERCPEHASAHAKRQRRAAEEQADDTEAA